LEKASKIIKSNQAADSACARGEVPNWLGLTRSREAYSPGQIQNCTQGLSTGKRREKLGLWSRRVERSTLLAAA